MYIQAETKVQKKFQKQISSAARKKIEVGLAAVTALMQRCRVRRSKSAVQQEKIEVWLAAVAALTQRCGVLRSKSAVQQEKIEVWLAAVAALTQRCGVLRSKSAMQQEILKLDLQQLQRLRSAAECCAANQHCSKKYWSWTCSSCSAYAALHSRTLLDRNPYAANNCCKSAVHKVMDVRSSFCW